MPDSDRQQIYKNVNTLGPLRYFVLLFVSSASILLGVLALLYHSEHQDYLQGVQLEEQVNMDLQNRLLEEIFNTIISDLLFLAQQNELQHLINTSEQKFKQDMAQEYLEFSLYKGVYDQIRYLDQSGNEIVRVNFNNGNPVAVSEDSLQYKGDRYYFRETVALGPGEVYVSPFDLNVENNIVEHPYKPMLRFSVPIFDRKGENRGILILNYLGARLIELLCEASRTSPGNIMLVNSDGYWLCSPEAEDEWGFMFADREQRTFSSRFPQVWKHLLEDASGQIYASNGLFTFSTIYPLNRILNSASATAACEVNTRPVVDEGYYWKLVSYISRDDLNAGVRSPIKTRRHLIAGVLLLMSAIPAWIIAQAIVRRRLSRLELYHSAHFDNLTQLPNRALFMDRMTQALRESKRYEQQFALLFIDLDGFKLINDTLGHDAGDELLQLTAARLLSCVRESDTVARIGGDEFAIILISITAVEDVKMIAGKIVNQVAAPFNFKNCTKHIGASIGISFYPQHGDQIDSLLNKADAAMYEAKKNGKNDFRISA